MHDSQISKDFVVVLQFLKQNNFLVDDKNSILKYIKIRLSFTKSIIFMQIYKTNTLLCTCCSQYIFKSKSFHIYTCVLDCTKI